MKKLLKHFFHLALQYCARAVSIFHAPIVSGRSAELQP